MLATLYHYGKIDMLPYGNAVPQCNWSNVFPHWDFFIDSNTNNIIDLFEVFTVVFVYELEICLLFSENE